MLLTSSCVPSYRQTISSAAPFVPRLISTAAPFGVLPPFDKAKSTLPSGSTQPSRVLAGHDHSTTPSGWSGVMSTMAVRPPQTRIRREPTVASAARLSADASAAAATNSIGRTGGTSRGRNPSRWQCMEQALREYIDLTLSRPARCRLRIATENVAKIGTIRASLPWRQVFNLSVSPLPNRRSLHPCLGRGSLAPWRPGPS